MINKIFKQRMEDPPPLENRARGVPAAFAAIVRKLMSKKPDERYQNCRRAAGRPGALDRPGAGPRDPRGRGRGRPELSPAAPELDEDDLRLLDGDGRQPRQPSPSATSATPSPRSPPGTRRPCRRPGAGPTPRLPRHTPAVEPRSSTKRHTLAHSFRDHCRRRRPHCDCLYSNLFPPVRYLARNVL